MLHKATAKNALRRIFCAVILLTVAFGAGASPAYADKPVIFVNEIVPFDVERYNECGADGAGEYVHLVGELHVVFFEVANSAGGWVYKSQVNPVNVSGVGLTSGTQYRGVGMSQGISTLHGDGETYTSINNFLLIGKGSGDNLVIHSTFHVTVNANGVETSVVEVDVDACH